MVRYFFNIRDSHTGDIEKDEEGAEFTSREKAYDEAVVAAKEIMAEKVRNGDVLDGQVFEITNADGVVVRELAFKSVLRLE